MRSVGLFSDLCFFVCEVKENLTSKSDLNEGILGFLEGKSVFGGATIHNEGLQTRQRG